MKRFGVKLISGKVVWVLADGATSEGGAILFYRQTDSGQEIIAGFSIAQINHFGVPEAFAADPKEETPGK